MRLCARFLHEFDSLPRVKTEAAATFPACTYEGASMKAPFLHRLVALARKEVLHIVRDVRVIYMALGMPVLLLLLFGYAVTFDLDRLPIALLDRDNTPASREYARYSSRETVVGSAYRESEGVF